MNRIMMVTGAVLTLAACGTDTPEHQERDLAPVAVTATTAWHAASEASHPAAKSNVNSEVRTSAVRMRGILRSTRRDLPSSSPPRRRRMPRASRGARRNVSATQALGSRAPPGAARLEP